MKFGVNTWVWTSPLTTEELMGLAPKVAEMGFDWIETPLESLDDLDYKQAAAIIKDNGLLVSACAAMGPDRDLIHKEKSTQSSLSLDYPEFPSGDLLGGGESPTFREGVNPGPPQVDIPDTLSWCSLSPVTYVAGFIMHGMRDSPLPTSQA